MEDLQSFLEEKYGVTFSKNPQGFFVPGMLGVIAEESKDTLNQRYDNLTNMAKSAWMNKKTLTHMETALLSTTSGEALAHLQSQIALAKKIKREPMPEVYETGEFNQFNYVVFNDFFFDACV